MPKTLLEKAKEAEVSRKSITPTPEEVELALAWLTQEVRSKQVLDALNNTSTTAIYSFLCRAFRKAYQDGKLIIK